LTYLAAVLHVLGTKALERVDGVRANMHEDSDRGSETIEKVLWAVAVIAIVGVVVTVIKQYVTTESGKIK
jgi:hypothetical protein